MAGKWRSLVARPTENRRTTLSLTTHTFPGRRSFTAPLTLARLKRRHVADAPDPFHRPDDESAAGPPSRAAVRSPASPSTIFPNRPGTGVARSWRSIRCAALIIRPAFSAAGRWTASNSTARTTSRRWRRRGMRSPATASPISRPQRFRPRNWNRTGAQCRFLKPFLGGAKLVSYAYPFGAVSLRTKRFYAPRFSNVRGVHPGVNEGRVDLAQLNAVSLESRCWDKDCRAIARVLHNPAGSSFTPMTCRTTPPLWVDAAICRKLGDGGGSGIEILPMREAVKVALD